MVRGSTNKYNTEDSYKVYLALSNKPVDKKIFLKVLNEFFKFAMNLVLSGDHIQLPHAMGSIFIKGRKLKPKVQEDGSITGLIPNWPETKKLRESNPEAAKNRKIVYCFNEHSNGIAYKIIWDKKEMYNINHNIYSLIFTRGNKRSVRGQILDGKEYLVK